MCSTAELIFVTQHTRVANVTPKKHRDTTRVMQTATYLFVDISVSKIWRFKRERQQASCKRKHPRGLTIHRHRTDGAPSGSVTRRLCKRAPVMKPWTEPPRRAGSSETPADHRTWTAMLLQGKQSSGLFAGRRRVYPNTQDVRDQLLTQFSAHKEACLPQQPLVCISFYKPRYNIEMKVGVGVAWRGDLHLHKCKCACPAVNESIFVSVTTHSTFGIIPKIEPGV